jgi:hypothetical protein
MKKEVKYDKLMNLRISTDLYNTYQAYCEDNGLVIASRIRYLIEKDTQGKIQIKNERIHNI